MKLQTLTAKSGEVQYEKMENEKNEAKAEELENEENCAECGESEKKSRVAALKDLVVDAVEKHMRVIGPETSRIATQKLLDSELEILDKKEVDDLNHQHLFKLPVIR